MTTKDAACIVNGVPGSVSLNGNKLKDNHRRDDVAQKIRNNILAVKTDNSYGPESIITSYRGRHTTPIQEFYRGTNIFITGGTGFLGKLLIEKLLYSCPHINMIYMLVRSKKGKNVDIRVQELFQDQIFNRVRKEYPNFREKIRILSGDCSEPGLGLSTRDRAGIIEHVHIVFNVAATVRFDEKLGIAISTNVRGTRDLMLLCKECHNIKSIVHVSTAYSHCYQSDIKEEFYDVPITSDRALKMVEALDEKILIRITPLLLGKWPNSYSYTKAIAEDAVRTYGKSIPVGVFRPSIIAGTRKEPIIGWSDSLHGPTGAIVGVGMGLIRTMMINDNAVADIVPSDMVVSALITSAWDIHERKSCGEENIPIYNYVSSLENPITWGDFIKIHSTKSWEIPFHKALWMVFLIPSRIHIIYKLYAFFLHTLPALFIDSALYSIGQKPKLLKTYRKLHKFIEMTAYFATRQWKFSNSNIQQLWQKLSSEDRSTFDFSITDLCWDDFFRDGLMGIRTYILKEDPRTLPDALKRKYRLFWLHQFVKLVFFGLLLRLLWIAIKPIVPVMSWEIVVTYYTKKIT